MRNFLLAAASVSFLTACVAANGSLANTAEAQAPEAKQTPMVSRNLSGVWQVLNTANDNVEAHDAKAAYQMREGPVAPVPAADVVAIGAIGAIPPGPSVIEGRQTLPYLPGGEEKVAENIADWVNNDPEVKCYLPGVPRATYLPHPFEIIQNDSQMLIVYEYANTVRNIFLEDPGEAPVDSWMGQSYGYWDGDTFVIEVTGQNGSSWLDRAGNHYSAAAKVTERYTPTGPDHIAYTATVDDPDTYSEPFTLEMTLYRLKGADARIEDFNCVPFVEEKLFGHLRKEPLQ
ncbi:hypothetical protein [Henriciella litoralis]|uniref:hypothetical protein n=1 Tax=Henriciella litoralis TaxID=568102 RepID=UPI000A00FE6E|nr:hypothetical protein [Henriciella litoralis]